VSRVVLVSATASQFQALADDLAHELSQKHSLGMGSIGKRGSCGPMGWTGETLPAPLATGFVKDLPLERLNAGGVLLAYELNGAVDC
jgi:hypothetical protein